MRVSTFNGRRMARLPSRMAGSRNPGFLPDRWNTGYSEALILYVLAAAAPRHPVAPEGYRQWAASFEVRKVYGLEYIYAGPLFIHQLSQIWLDLRGVRDELNRRLGFDYFENSRRATYIHRQYGIENPGRFKHYGEYVWGLTASGGPGPATVKVDGECREFYGYVARGAPFGPDDGTVSPWAVVASIPFAPRDRHRYHAARHRTSGAAGPERVWL